MRDGAHVGVICKQTPAIIAKQAIQRVLETTGLKHEVNPKQDSVEEGKFGNLVKAPFQFHNRTKQRSTIINPETLKAFERQDAIKYMMELPDTVFAVKEGIETPVQTIKEAPSAVIEPIKSDMRFVDLFGNLAVKPCIAQAYDGGWKLHGTGDQGHDFRLAVAGNLLDNGVGDELIHEFFKKQTDYSRKETHKGLNSIKAYLAGGNARPMGCAKILEKCSSFVGGICPTCTYSKKPKKSKEPNEQKPKEIKADVGEVLAAGLGVYKGNMELVEAFQKVCHIYHDVSKNSWLWMPVEGYYKRIDDVDILSAIRKRCSENVIESKVAGEILRGIQITGRERAVKDVPKTWVHTYSGIVDYISGERITARADYFLTSPIPHKIGTCGDIPMISKLFKEWVGDQDAILYEWLAYLLVNDYPMHRMLILFGSGRNGKGEFADLLIRFVGMENMTSTDLEKLIESRFETSKLYRKKLAVIDETDFNAIKNTARIKAISGGSRIGGEFKGRDGFDFYNTAKITILTNNLPESLDKTEAFYSRCIIQEFANKFDEGKSVSSLIPEVEFENLLFKCIKLLPDLMKKGKFTNEGSIEEKAEKYEKMSNPFSTFLKRELVEEVNSELPIWVIREKYEVFCAKNGFRKVGEKEFTQILKKEEFIVKRVWWGTKNWNSVLGLNTKTPYIYIESDVVKKDEMNQMNQMNHVLESVCIRELPSGTPRTSGSSGSKPENIVSDNTQLAILTYTRNMLLKAYGFRCVDLPSGSRDLEAANVRAMFSTTQETARSYVDRAIQEISAGH